jgi:2-oxoglutarate ferredoxin oxidoreductase subunit alpha
MYDLTYEAFELADKYRNPVMILADGVVGQMMEPAVLNKKNLTPSDLPKKDWALDGCLNRQPRLIRSLLMAEGALEEHNYKLAEKYQKISRSEIRYEVSNLENAEILLVGFGLCGRIIKEVQMLAGRKKISAGTIRPITLWPFPSEIVRKAARKAKKILVVEMNTGQMLEDVQLAVAGRTEVDFLGVPGGGIPTPEKILQRVLSYKI